jgi:hypothetical protein
MLFYCWAPRAHSFKLGVRLKDYSAFGFFFALEIYVSAA